MKKILSALALIVISNAAFCQLVAEQNTGRLFRVTTNNDVTGSPYLFNDWKRGSVTFDNDTKIENLNLKFDVLHNKFLFNRNDSTYEFINDVREIRIKDEKNDDKELVFKKVINSNNKIPSGAFVQVLSSGKVTLLKYFSKRVEGENFTNGIVTTTKQIVSHDNLWATLNNQTIPVKLSKRTLEELTADKKNDVENYIKAKKLHVKSEKDFVAAINYYNTNGFNSNGQ